MFGGEGIQHKITVENCHFINNTGTLVGGGIQFTLYTTGRRTSPNTVIVNNCYFFQNQGGHGEQSISIFLKLKAM